MIVVRIDHRIELRRDREIELRKKPERQADRGGDDERDDETGAIYGLAVAERLGEGKAAAGESAATKAAVILALDSP